LASKKEWTAVKGSKPLRHMVRAHTATGTFRNTRVASIKTASYASIRAILTDWEQSGAMSPWLRDLVAGFLWGHRLRALHRFWRRLNNSVPWPQSRLLRIAAKNLWFLERVVEAAPTKSAHRQPDECACEHLINPEEFLTPRPRCVYVGNYRRC